MKKIFLTPDDIRAIKIKIEEAEKIGNTTTNRPDQDFLSGVQATLEWLIGQGDDPLEDYK